MPEAEEIFESAVRSTGDLAGVFEFDGETSYFYLYRTGGQGNQVLDSIHISSELPDFATSDVAVRWTRNHLRVGLFIRGELWAVFDTDRKTKFGGNYRARTRPALSSAAREGFERALK